MNKTSKLKTFRNYHFFDLKALDDLKIEFMQVRVNKTQRIYIFGIITAYEACIRSMYMTSAIAWRSK